MSRKTISDEDAHRMMEAAMNAKTNAYCPYSNFRVGSAVLTSSGKIFTGCNVENASYGLTLCAERVAISTSVAEGHQDIVAVLASTDLNSFKWPCGACTQFILEFGEDVLVVACKPDRSYEIKTIRELAPFAFCRADLMANNS
eukprot:NODE_9262_length_608_cov_21.806186_g8630_i0.p1 GENE.NODE_9262_length_608_cov_21.806186_g8630_i0~~NODE_9262_length_608_cov_21.806186_g8630_i0.p1  ORF type:complete len:143 (-),score=36.60 NODE_9262_length_608_cov_21.806186_g8630_i0:122-550(-)